MIQAFTENHRHLSAIVLLLTLGALHPSNTGRLRRNSSLKWWCCWRCVITTSEEQYIQMQAISLKWSLQPQILKWVAATYKAAAYFWIRSHSIHKIYKICIYDWAVHTQAISIAIYKHLSLYTIFFKTVYPGRISNYWKFKPLRNVHI